MISGPAKIALGTVQFGLAYGINNKKGQVSAGEVADILRLASEAGIDTLDTAHDYGTSEEVLGKVLKREGLEFKIVSKLPIVANARELHDAVETSLRRLNQNRLYGYLVHDFESFVRTPSLWDELRLLKKRNIINQIGFSLYYPRQLETLEKCHVDYDIVQVPFNVFDQRFAPFFPSLGERGVEIHTRSIFLQGLFFKKIEELSGHFNPIKHKIVEIRALADRCGVDVNQLLLGFGLLNENIDRVIIGIDSLDHLTKNISVFKLMNSMDKIKALLTRFSEMDETILLPFNWK